MNLEKVEDILKIKKSKLMAWVPTSKKPTSWDYNDVYKANYNWYAVITGLSGKCTDSKKRAGKMNFDYDLDLHYVVELWIKQKGKCQLTGQIMSFTTGTLWDKNPTACSIDRIDNTKGYVRGNVRLLTHWANNAKSTWDHKVFENMIKSAAGVLHD